jgi:hypothetical protein
VQDDIILFPEVSSAHGNMEPTPIPRFDPSLDPEGVSSYVPHMEHFYDNSLQTGLMRDLAIDLEILGEHVVLLGNQVIRINLKVLAKLIHSFSMHREWVKIR